jgi:hypothetical protein
MMQLRARQSGVLGSVSLMAGVVSWHAAIFMLAALTVSGGLQLLIERQRQHAFRAMVSRAPEGAVMVMQDGGPGGRYMRASLGAGLSCQSPGRP